MKGFVPVKKENLLSMIADCRTAADKDCAEKVENEIASYIKSDKERMATKRWYRLWRLPDARFTHDEKGVRKYLDDYQYDMFESNPLENLEKSLKTSHRWLDRLQRVAESHNSEEPITLGMETFMRLENPENYHWTRSSWYWAVE